MSRVSAKQPPLEARLLQALRAGGESHGRALAVSLGADPGAVARRLVIMKEKGLIQSRWAGRTRLYRPASVKKARKDPLIVEAIDRLSHVKQPTPLAILAFGSRVAGNARPDSDLDLVVVVPDGTNTTAGYRRLSEAVRGLPVPVDLVIYSRTGARKWANLPANPLRKALDLHPESSSDFLVA